MYGAGCAVEACEVCIAVGVQHPGSRCGRVGGWNCYRKAACVSTLLSALNPWFAAVQRFCANMPTCTKQRHATPMSIPWSLLEGGGCTGGGGRI